MSPHRLGPHTPSRYEIRIEGHLDEHWSTWFDGLTLVCENDGTTTLHGVVADQAVLHGLLAKVRDIGVTLISVTSAEAPDQVSDGPTCVALTQPVPHALTNHENLAL